MFENLSKKSLSDYLFTAIKNDDVATARELVKNGANIKRNNLVIIDDELHDYLTPLEYAVYINSFNSIVFLIEECGYKWPKTSNSILKMALDVGKVKTVRYLIKHGIHVDPYNDIGLIISYYDFSLFKAYINAVGMGKIKFYPMDVTRIALRDDDIFVNYLYKRGYDFSNYIVTHKANSIDELTRLLMFGLSIEDSPNWSENELVDYLKSKNVLSINELTNDEQTYVRLKFC